jgi:hypothetical protein
MEAQTASAGEAISSLSSPQQAKEMGLGRAGGDSGGATGGCEVLLIAAVLAGHGRVPVLTTAGGPDRVCGWCCPVSTSFAASRILYCTFICITGEVLRPSHTVFPSLDRLLTPDFIVLGLLGIGGRKLLRAVFVLPFDSPLSVVCGQRGLGI